MYYYDDAYHSDAVFESAGIFVTTEPWIHTQRTLESYEIILLLDGILPIEIGGQRYHVKPQEFLVLPPATPHGGFAYTKGETRFLWFHFNFKQKHLRQLNQSDFTERFKGTEFLPNFLALPTYFDRMDMHRLLLMSTQLLDIYQEKVSPEYLNAYLNTILHEISYQTVRLIKKDQITNNDLQPIQDWIRIHAFEDISLQDVADYFNYNKNYLSRKYKAIMGIGIAHQITKYRIARAKFLLSDTNKTIQEIGNLVGYEDPKYFMRTFKNVENNTPSEYRRAFHKKHFNLK